MIRVSRAHFRAFLVFGSLLCVFGSLLCVGCSSGQGTGNSSCNPDDQNGLVGGTSVVLLNVSDTGFAVGGVNSGSSQPNIAVENSSTVMLTISNVGSKPHDLVVGCAPSGLSANCPQSVCFPSTANVKTLDPGQMATVTFKAPAVEGAYRFTSDLPGDTQTATDGTQTGLVGEFVLM